LREAIFPAEEEIPKQYRRSVILWSDKESIMWMIIDLLYREYCLARLQEMRKITLAR